MKTHLNLVPQEWRRRQLVKRHIVRWSRIAALIAALATVCWWRTSDDLVEARDRLAVLEIRASLYRDQLAANASLEEQITASERRKSLFNRLSAPQQPLQLVGIISDSSRRQNGRVRVLSFRLAPHETAATAATIKRERPGTAVRPIDEPTQSARTAVNLSGVASDDFALSRFIASLRTAGVFVDVELKSSREIKIADESAREYEVHCIF